MDASVELVKHVMASVAHIHAEAIVVILALGTDRLLEFVAADADLDFSAALGEHADLDGFV